MKKIAIVQPMLAPYSIPRFKELGKYNDIEIHILIERDRLSHRPGWGITNIEGCKLHLLNSFIKNQHSVNSETKYLTKGIRAIPYKLPKVLNEIRPDLVIVCNATQLLFANLFKKKLGYKLGIVVEDTNNSEKNRTKFNKKMKSLLLKYADFYLPYSNDAIKYLHDKKIKNNIFKSSWSIDTSDMNNCVKSKTKKIDTIKIISVARLVEGKGIDKFLEAFASLNLEIKNKFYMEIVGGGPDEEKLIGIIKNNNLSNVKLIGEISHKEVTERMLQADIFVLPTLGDLFSLVVMEAMAAGLPVITTNYNGASELVEEEENGYIFDPYNPEDIKATIEKIYANRDKLLKMGEESKKKILNYNHYEVMQKLYNILKEI